MSLKLGNESQPYYRSGTTVNGREEEEDKSFTHLGSTVTTDGGTIQGVYSCIKKANGAFVELYSVWRNKNIFVRTKILLLNTNVKSVLLHRYETWQITKWISNSLQVFVNWSL
jgi:hypothetical protein